MTIAEYCERVQRLKKAFPALEADFNVDEGLTLVLPHGGRRIVFIGEATIVEEMEAECRAILKGMHDALNGCQEGDRDGG